MRKEKVMNHGSFVKVVICILLLPVMVLAQPSVKKPVVPVGIFIGSIEEGARIFTPVRLLPFEHPESLGHQFPTVLQLHGTELPVLLWLGQEAGYKLWPTLTRYPAQPSPDWPYKEFAQPDTTNLRLVQCIRQPASTSPLKGLRAVLFQRYKPVAFIVDTRGLTLKERGMERATSMGLDISRADFLKALDKAGLLINGKSSFAVIFGK